MTRICMVCGTTIGEKCPQCGAEAAPDRRHDGWHVCPEHGAFRTGDGGPSHGVCAVCEPAWRKGLLPASAQAGGGA